MRRIICSVLAAALCVCIGMAIVGVGVIAAPPLKGQPGQDGNPDNGPMAHIKQQTGANCGKNALLVLVNIDLVPSGPGLKYSTVKPFDRRNKDPEKPGGVSGVKYKLKGKKAIFCPKASYYFIDVASSDWPPPHTYWLSNLRHGEMKFHVSPDHPGPNSLLLRLRLVHR